MKCCFPLLLVFVWLLSAVGLASGSISEHVSVLSSSDAPGTISKARVTSCLRELLRQWNLRESNLPDVMIYHVSKKAAAMAHVKGDVSARNNRLPSHTDAYFEIWVVGEPRPDKYIVALQNILEAHFGINPSEEKRNQILLRVFRMQDAIVEVQAK